MKPSLVVSVACLTCCWFGSLSFSFSSLQTSTRPRSSLFVSSGGSTREDSVRAGTDGYSVLRQPLDSGNWNPEADPRYEAPQRLNEERSDDDSWWSTRKQPSSSANKQQTSLTKDFVSEKSFDETAEQLDLFQRTLDTLDYPRVLRSLEQECSTAPARNLVRQATRISKERTPKKNRKIDANLEKAYQPITADTVEGTQERYAAVREMALLLSDDDRLDEYHYRDGRGYKQSLGLPPFKGLSFNLAEILDIVDQGRVLEGPEILDISTMMDAMEEISLWGMGLEKVQDPEFVELPKLAGLVSVNSTLQEFLSNAFDNEGKLSGKTFPTIGRLRALVRARKAEILQTLNDMLQMPSIQSKLALESGGPTFSEVNSGRLVIPINPKSASSIGIVHDTSRSGKTVYVEPSEIVGPTNELRQAEAELRSEEARVWRSLTKEIVSQRDTLEGSVYAVGQLDLVLARCLLGKRLHGVVPQVENNGVVSLRDAKHPVLLLREVENVVGNDIDIGADGNRGLVLTGPNSGGKTVILKLLGLMALMARNGIPVPAGTGARVDFFDPVLADIGDLQSVGGDLSTFSGHMLVCREVLANSGANAMVLMDELGSGTNPAEGVAIAQALLEALIETGARVAITTHYMQLKQLAASDDRFAVAGMQFVRGKPTYKLVQGTVGESYALAVAERLQLPQSVLERANELLDSDTRQMGDLLRDLEDQKALVDDQAAEIAQKRKEIAALEIDMKLQKRRLEQKQLGARREEAKKFAQNLEEKERVLEDILNKLKSDPSRKIVAKSWDDIKFVKRDALSEAENVPSVVARKKKAAKAIQQARDEMVPIAEMREKPELNAGDKLVVCKAGALFGREATVVKNLGKSVQVQVANMNIGLKMTEVSLPTSKMPSKTSSNKHNRGNSISRAAARAIEAEGKGPQQGTAPVERKKTTVAIRTAQNTIDVRGSTLQEAIELVKDKFSSCIMMGRPVVYILHGHGTSGALKNKIRGWLKSERQLVKRFQAADAADGGDAFTRVELR